MIELKINQIIVTDDITQLPLSVQKKVLEEMTIARDKLTNEMSRVRLNIRDLESRPTLEELVIEHIRKESRFASRFRRNPTQSGPSATGNGPKAFAKLIQAPFRATMTTSTTRATRSSTAADCA